MSGADPNLASNEGTICPFLPDEQMFFKPFAEKSYDKKKLSVQRCERGTQ